MRLDRLLFNLRFARSRTLAQRWIGEGHIRRNGMRVVRQDLPVAIGDVLTLPLRSAVLVVELLALPERRGPPAAARACYRRLDDRPTLDLGGGNVPPDEGPAQGETQP
jgi:ribosome-associated heat shock protein Hsp15